MNPSNETSRILSMGRALAVMLQPIAALVTRLVIGWTFLQTGMGKWHDIDKVAQFFADSGIPAAGANARFIASLEVVGGICLMLGLGTRVFAALLSCTMVVALMTADRPHLLGVLGLGGKASEDGLMDVTPIPFLLPLLWLVAFGAGAIAVDRILFRRYDTTVRA